MGLFRGTHVHLHPAVCVGQRSGPVRCHLPGKFLHHAGDCVNHYRGYHHDFVCPDAIRLLYCASECLAAGFARRNRGLVLRVQTLCGRVRHNVAANARHSCRGIAVSYLPYRLGAFPFS